ncbi:MAG: hypothetical protein DA408_08560 [Bacteroidetes bacterium]|nr:MAG: hypothetical protein C7N36_00115 [Bacteroidota bacterium]PTM12897.1 MAG: hypothetical protein DA408_08560 [Bacteroidota bacterium]
MIKHLITGIAFVFFAIFSTHLYAQQKYEKESRLTEKDVPDKALDFIDSLGVERKIRWYLEEGFDRTSIEAKFKLNNQKYSIEFDTVGNLEDIEIQIAWSKWQKPLKDSISFHLKKDCKRFKINKIQIQYSGDQSILLTKIKTGEDSGEYIIKYEVIVKCCNTKNVALFEYLFSNTGQELAVSKIVFKNSSNLEY